MASFSLWLLLAFFLLFLFLVGLLFVIVVLGTLKILRAEQIPVVSLLLDRVGLDLGKLVLGWWQMGTTLITIHIIHIIIQFHLVVLGWARHDSLFTILLFSLVKHV